MTRLTLTLLAIATIGLCQPAQARHHRAAPACSGWFCPASGPSAAPAQRTHHAPVLARRAPRFASYDRGSTVSHPAGCPGRAFCGCGASVRVFGHPVRDLYLASNWFRFPRAAPASDMVGVRSHHVFVLESHVEGNTWMVYDANSGGHATRVHARSIAGYAIVNPHGSRYAAAN